MSDSWKVVKCMYGRTDKTVTCRDVSTERYAHEAWCGWDWCERPDGKPCPFGKKVTYERTVE